MAFESVIRVNSFVTAISYASKQFCFVALSALAATITNPTLGGYSIGVIQSNPASGEPGDVCVPGSITKVQCAGTFNAGDEISTDASGKCIAAASGDFVLGRALAAGANGSVVSILFQPETGSRR